MTDLYTNVCRQVRGALGKHNNKDLAIVQCIANLVGRNESLVDRMDQLEGEIRRLKGLRPMTAEEIHAHNEEVSR